MFAFLLIALWRGKRMKSCGQPEVSILPLPGGPYPGSRAQSHCLHPEEELGLCSALLDCFPFVSPSLYPG